MKKRQSVKTRRKKETRKQRKFLDLAKRFRSSTDPQEAKRLGDKLGRLVFGS
jgi:hypothetical protein